MGRIFGIGFLLLFSISAESQDLFELVLADELFPNDPIAKAVAISEHTKGISSDSGELRIYLKEDECITIKHLSYRDTSICYHQLLNLDTLKLKRKVNELNLVDISSKPTVLFKDDEAHVMDFVFIGDSLLILTYEKEKMFRRASKQSKSLYLNCELLLISPNGRILQNLAMVDLIEGFYTDVLGQNFIITENAVFLVIIKPSRIQLQPVEEKVFKDQIQPVKASITSMYVLDNFVWHYPEFSFFIHNQKTDGTQIMRTIEDSFTMELLRSEYKYMNNRDKLWAIRKEMETGIDKEVLAAYKTGFQSSFYYESLYAPIYRHDNSFLIFDHHNGYIYKHDSLGSSVDSTRIEYTDIRYQKFDDEIISDSGMREFYAVYKKSGIKYLGNLDLKSGRALKISKLYYPYPEKIKIRNGSAYYLYRKPNEPQYTYLYMEPIK